MNRLDPKTRALIIRYLVEGQSIRTAAVTADVSKNTVAKLLIDVGKACADYQDKTLRNLLCRRIQVDEIWSFIYAKEMNAARARSALPEAGDVWTWTAICADTKLIPSWRVGDRSCQTATDFMDDLRLRFVERMQLTSDGHRAYLEAVEGTFRADVGFAQLVQLYGEASEAEKPYGPATCVGFRNRRVEDNHDPAYNSTSDTERNNLTMRMSIYRFTRLTNAFSKKIWNHAHSVALHFMHYNFCCQHKSLRGISPAMAANVTTRLWDIEDIVRLVDEAGPKPGPRGPYKKRVAHV